MKKLFLCAALAPLTAWSVNSANVCGVAGEWVRIHQARANSMADALVENNGAPPSRYVFSQAVYTFTDDGMVIGGGRDGLQMQGWLATNWECEGKERVVLSAAGGSPVGPLAERVKLITPDLLEIPSGGFGSNKQFIRFDGSREAAAENLNNAVKYLREIGSR